MRPGLYALGSPAPDSPVFVTANYTLSFDALRSSLPGADGYILVLDTRGINVWCAAGKGTFGTDELVARVAATGLSEIVSHRRLVLPQLGAPGVQAHVVRRSSGFKVEYGPVRAADLPAYLAAGQATPDMRRVRFPLADRLVLVPVEVVHMALPMLLIAIAAYFAGGGPAAWGVVAAVAAGVALFPALLPWLPTADFSSKGFLLGAVVAAPFAVWAAASPAGSAIALARAAGLMLLLPAITAFLSLNFTGATPITSRSGVEEEIRVYIRPMAAAAIVGALLLLAALLAGLTGLA